MNNTLRDKVREMERVEILDALRECRWIMAKAARKLGITERMIAYKIRKYGIGRTEEEKSRSTQSNVEQE